MCFVALCEYFTLDLLSCYVALMCVSVYVVCRDEFVFADCGSDGNMCVLDMRLSEPIVHTIEDCHPLVRALTGPRHAIVTDVVVGNPGGWCSTPYTYLVQRFVHHLQLAHSR